jgi:hypothetical protein
MDNADQSLHMFLHTALVQYLLSPVDPGEPFPCMCQVLPKSKDSEEPAFSPENPQSLGLEYTS